MGRLHIQVGFSCPKTGSDWLTLILPRLETAHVRNVKTNFLGQKEICYTKVTTSPIPLPEKAGSLRT